MAVQSVTEIRAREPDSYVDLWGTINQLESVLEVANEDFCAMVETEGEQYRHLRNRAHNLLGAAQELAARLASVTRVR